MSNTITEAMTQQDDSESLEVTQKEIYDNMTKGVWHLEMEFVCSITRKTKPLYEDLNLPDGAAIVSAVNNTYGKGINPEAVPQMQHALALALTSIRQGIDLKYTTQKIEEALIAAKL